MTKNSLEYPRANPVTTASQYALMQAIAHGAVPQQDVSISQELAREMIRKTPRRLRSKFAAELAKMHNPILNPTVGEVYKFADKHGIRLEPIRNIRVRRETGYKYKDIDTGERFKDWREVRARYEGRSSNPLSYIAKLYGRSGQAPIDTGSFYDKESMQRWIDWTTKSFLSKRGHGEAYIEVTTPEGKYTIPSPLRKGNPSAEALTEEWHGREPREVIDVEEEEEYEPDGAVLAELEELGILLEDREQTIGIEFNEDPPMLVANVATENLEVVGGDQKLEFGEGWGSTKNEFTVGHVYLIAYCTDKHHLEGSNGVPESYEHFFGEEFYKEKGYKVDDYKDSEDFFEDLLEDGIVDEAIEAGYLPTMVYDTINEKIKLVGGRYTIEDVGLRD